MQINIRSRPADKMDLKAKANDEDYVKNLIFLKKEMAILKLRALLNSTSIRIRITYLKIIPVLFSFAELNEICIVECLEIIAKLKRHPSFSQEKSLFDGWQSRLQKLLPGCESMIRTVQSEANSTESKFFIIPGTNMYDIIGYAELDLFSKFNKFLKFNKLHKYLYFFANLSFLEIQSINSDNIRHFEAKVGLHPMTDGARNAILRKLQELHQRSARLEVFAKKEYYSSISKVEKSIFEIKSMLKTPIRRNQVFSGDNLPDLLKKAIEKVVNVILRLPKIDLIKVYEPAISLLKLAYGAYFFEIEDKKKFNLLQAALHSKHRNYLKKKSVSTSARHYMDRKDFCAIQIEQGICAITWYLENVVLKDI